MTDPKPAVSGPPLRRLVEAMPKAELHLHLDGSLRVDTAIELARTRDIDAPRDWLGMSNALIAPMPCASQAELLRAFDLPIALMQDAEALERITAELVETKAADGVRYVEIRWGPLLHVAGGLSLADGIGAVCAGAQAASFRTGSVVRLICTALRSHDPEANLELARTAVQFRDHGLTGWDLAGPEEAYPGSDAPRRGVRGGSRGRPADHDPRRRMGRRGSGPPGAGRRTGTDRPRTGRHRRPAAVRGADVPGGDARPVPDLELAGRHRAVRRGTSAGATPPGGRAGDAQHGRHDGLGHHAVRGVRQRGRADRPDSARGVGNRPAGARRGLRGRDGPGAAPRRVRSVGGRRSRSWRPPADRRGRPVNRRRDAPGSRRAPRHRRRWRSVPRPAAVPRPRPGRSRRSA